MRKLIALFISLALCLSLASALAEQTVTVTGSGETLVTADTAVVSVGVTVRRADALEAQSGANEVIASIRPVRNPGRHPGILQRAAAVSALPVPCAGSNPF